MKFFRAMSIAGDLYRMVIVWPRIRDKLKDEHEAFQERVSTLARSDGDVKVFKKYFDKVEGKLRNWVKKKAS